MKYLLIIFFIPLLSIAQSRDLGPGSSIFSNNLGDFALQKIDKVYNNEFSNKVSGDTHLFSDWKPCYVTTNIKNGLVFCVPCNYNLLLDQFEMKVGDDIYPLKKNSIVNIRQGENIYIPNYRMDTKDSKNFMELLAEGQKFDLIKVYNLKIKEVQSSTSLGLYEKKIRTTDKLYFRDKNNGQIIEVPRSNKKIMAILNLNSAQKIKIPGNLKNIDNLIKAVEL